MKLVKLARPAPEPRPDRKAGTGLTMRGGRPSPVPGEGLTFALGFAGSAAAARALPPRPALRLAAVDGVRRPAGEG